MTSIQQFSAKRASHNALLLMFRTIVGILIGLITSRLVFNTLGAEDYGLNVVVGGLLPAFTFVAGVLATATSRFLTFEIGRGHTEKVRATFTATFWAHLFLAIMLVVICEIGGIYLLKHQLQIPAGRETASMVALQCSIVGVFFGVTQVPYSAVLVANERFKQFAYISLLGSFLALAAALYLRFTSWDKLIVYVVLTALNSVFCALLNRWYCLRHHPESHLQRRVQWRLLRPILNYTLWELFGNGCLALYNQSKNFWVNKFFGVGYNASVNVASTISGTIESLKSPIGSTFSPSITKQFAQGNFAEMERAMLTYVRFTLLICAMIVVPLALNADIVFRLWLGNVPSLAPELLHSLLLASVFVTIGGPFNHALVAIGRLEWSSIIGGVYMLLIFVGVYVIFRTTGSLILGFYLMAISELGHVLRASLLVKYYAPELQQRRYFLTIGKILVCATIACIPTYGLHLLISSPFLHLFATTISYVVGLPLTFYALILVPYERKILQEKLQQWAHKMLKH